MAGGSQMTTFSLVTAPDNLYSFLRSGSQDINPDVLGKIGVEHCSIPEALCMREINSSWRQAIDHELEALWNRVKKHIEGVSRPPMQSLEGMILRAEKEVSACKKFKRLSCLFMQIYGEGFGTKHNLQSLPMQIEELRAKQQSIQDHALCGLWEQMRKQMQVSSAPPLTSTAGDIRSWTRDPANVAVWNKVDTLVRWTRGELHVIPHEIWRFAQLKTIIFSCNFIKELSPEIGALRHLTYLDLSQNCMKEIPVEISQCTQLRYLYMQSNQIRDISFKIGQLVALKELSVSDNQITHFPETILQLIPQMSKFGFRCNPIKSFPSRFLSSPPPSILGSCSLKEFRATVEYPAHSPLARLYQAIIQGNREAIRTSLSQLNPDEQQKIWYQLGQSTKPYTNAQSWEWGQECALENKDCLIRTTRNIILDSFLGLSSQKQESTRDWFKQILERSISHFGLPFDSCHVMGIPPILADAISIVKAQALARELENRNKHKATH
jgi:hypothetical protein